MLMTEPGYKISAQSLACSKALPSIRQESSRKLGWTSLLLDHHWFTSSRDDYSSIVTPDQTIGLAVAGRYDLDIYRGGRWHRSVRQPGSIGMGRGGEPTRGRLTIAPNRMAESALLYLPDGQLQAAFEHLRRIGHPAQAPSFNVLVERDPAVAQMFANLMQAMRNGVDELYAGTAAAWLAVHLVTRYGMNAGQDENRSAGTITDSRLARVIELMSVRFADELTLEDLASEACISKYHFARLFRQKMDCAPYAFLTEIRMDTARRLLATSDLPIAEIAISCGYPVPANFSAAFLARYGITPSAFRTEHQGHGVLRR